MVDEIILRFSVKDDGSPVIEKVNQKLTQTKKASEGLVPGLEAARSKLTGFVSQNAALIGILAGVGLALNKISKDTVAYANEVRTLSNVSKTSAEDSSRFLQVLDDYKLGLNDATTAARAMKEQGLVPTIETIADLAEQYQAIQDPAQQLAFIQKNLGRDTAKWTEILSKSKDTLLKQNDAIDKNLILTQKQVDAARRLELAEDAKNDALQAVSVTLGNKLIPLQTDVLNGLNVWIRGIEIATERNIGMMEATDIAGFEIYQEQQAMIAAADAADDTSGSLDDLGQSQESAADTAKRLSDIYTGLLSSMFSIQQENDSYTETVANLTQESEDLIANKNRLIMKMTEEKEAGKLTNDEYMRYVEQLAEMTKAQEENAKSIEDAAADHEKASKQREYDLARERLASNGLTSDEFEGLQTVAVQKGLVSKAAADQAIAESKAADLIVASLGGTVQAMNETEAAMMAIRAQAGQVQFSVNFQSNVPQNYNVPGASYNTPNPQAAPGGYGYHPNRDNGGSGVAGEMYMIGRGAQPEMFVAPSNGQFIPNADKLGNTYNIVVNNPKKETAENSIRRALKRGSRTGVVA